MKLAPLLNTSAATLLLAGSAFGAVDLVPTKLQLPTAITNPPLPLMTVRWTVTNKGDSPAAGFWDALYISTNSTFDASFPQLSTWYVYNPVSPGGSYSRAATLQFPVTSSGDYFVFLKTDIFDSLQESDEANNLLMAPLHFEAVPSDLAIDTILVPNVLTVPSNPYLTLAWSVTNLGPGVATGNWLDSVYLSTDAALTPAAFQLGPFSGVSLVPVGGVYWHTNQAQLPGVTNGTYYLIFSADIFNSLFELNLSNNSRSVPITFSVRQPDLAALPLQVPTHITSLANPLLPVVWGVTNDGPVAAQGNWTDQVFVSTNTIANEQSDPVIGQAYESGSVLPGASYFRTNSLQIPVRRSGTYYLIFQADAHNALSESSFSNNVSIQAVTFDIQQPDLAPLAFQVPNVVTSPPNPVLKFSWGVTNQGSGSTSGYWSDVVYLSTNSVLDSTAITIASLFESSLIDSGEVYWRTNLLQLPVTQSGTYYLTFRTDAANSLDESDTNNNTVVRPITLAIQPPNLAPIAFQVSSPITTSPNPTVQVIWGVTNTGTGTAVGNWYDRIYFSTDAQFDTADLQEQVSSEFGPIPARGSYWRTNSVQLPITQSGTYYLIFVANNDSNFKIFESDYSDNLRIVPVTFNILPPDLAPVVSRLPSKITGPPFPTATVVWGITNQGTGTAQGMTWTDGLYLSSDPIFDQSDSLISPGYEFGPIPPGGVLWLTNTVPMPVTSNRTGYFIARANLDNSLFESDYNNNIAVTPVSFEIRPPDLAPIALQAPNLINGPSYPSVTVIWGVTNQGIGDAIGHYAWYDRLYVSTSATWDITAVDVFSSSESGPVAPGDIYWRTNTVRLPITASGFYYLFLRANINTDLIESDYGNNTSAVPFTFNAHPPDLAPVAIQVPNSITGPPYPSLTYVWGVTNQGAGAAQSYSASWVDSVSFSTNDFGDSSEYSLGSSYHDGPVPPGGVYWQTNTVRLPATQSGTYYLIFSTDDFQTLSEADYDNNIVVVPVTITIQQPDLKPIALQAPSNLTCPPNPILTVMWGVTNQGAGSAVGYYSWSDQLYFSSDPVWNPQDLILAGGAEYGPVLPGQTYWQTNSVRIPATQSGIYYLILKIDDGNSLIESGETNNIVIAPITLNVLPPDLAPVPPAPLTIDGPPNPTFALVWGVTNQGIGPAIPPWNDLVYFSKKPKFNPQDPQLSFSFETLPIEPGTVSWQTNSVSVPVIDSGNYYFVFNANANGANALYESDYSNNIAVVPVTFKIHRPDLAPIALQSPGQITATPNPLLTFAWAITNQGAGAAIGSFPSGNWSDALFLSTNAFLDDTARLISSEYAPNPISPGGSYWLTNLVNVPVTKSGTYYFILHTDDNGALLEADYDNNTLVVPVTFTILPPDLAPLALLTSTVVTSTPNPVLSVVWGVTNQGIGAAQGFWYDSLFLATNSLLDPTATPVFLQNETGPIPAGSNYWRTNLFQLPLVQSGHYFLILKANNNNLLFENDFGNNTLSIPLTFTILPPDLSPIALKAPAVVISPPNPSINLEWGVTNKGTGAALLNGGSWSDRIYLSTTPDATGGLNSSLVSQFERGPVGAGGQYWRSQWARTSVTKDGTYYLILQIDADRALYESDENNNTLAVPITFKIQKPDLAPLSLQAPSVVNGSANPSLKLTWGVTNQGSGAAITPWLDSFYLSSDARLDSSDISMGGQWTRGSLPAGSSYWRSQTVQVPIKASGNYYIILQTGAGNEIGESDVNNNILAVPVSFNLPAPNLAPVVFQVPAQVEGSLNPGVTMIWGVTNQGPGIATNASYNFLWVDQVSLSTSPTADLQNDPIIFSDYSPTQLAPGAVYWRTNIVRVPVTNDGVYYLHFRANAHPYEPLYESDYSNNTATVQVGFHLSAPDLVPFSFQAPTNISGAEGQLVTLVWGVTNQGPGAAFGTANPWQDFFELTKLDPLGPVQAPVALWGVFQTNTVNPGQSYWSTNIIPFPAVDRGLYQLKLTADAFNNLLELNTSNNTASLNISVDLIPPDLAPVGFSGPSVVTGPPNPLVTVTWGVTNQSISTAALFGNDWFDRLYLSTNSFFDGAAMFLGSWEHAGFLAAGGIYWRTNTVQLPVQSPGKYYLILDLDVYDNLHESDESNNFASLPVTVNLLSPSDLKPLGLQIPAIINGPANPPVTFVWGVTNQGLGAAESLSGWSDGLFLSILPPPSITETALAFFRETNQIPPGAVYWRTNTVTTPIAASGQYFLTFKANSQGELAESDYGNNVLAVPVTFNILPPDLALLALQAPSAVAGAPNPAVTVIAGITNQGPGSALPGTDLLYISATPFVDGSAQVAAYLNRTSTIPSGGSYWHTNSVRLPVVDSGNYYLIFQADQDNVLGEFDSLNNVAVVPIRVDLSLQPDLALHEFQYPRVVAGGANPRVQLIWHVANEGLGPAVAPWSDTVVLYTNFNTPGAPVISVPSVNSLAVGTSYWRTNKFTLPLVQSGICYLALGINSGNEVAELDYNNNNQFVSLNVIVTNATPVTLTGAQLLPDRSFQLGVSGARGGAYTLESSTNLIDWTREMDFFCTNSPTWLVDRHASGFAQQFFRVAPYLGASATPLILDFGVLPPLATNGLELKLDGPLAGDYRVETSTNLVNWNAITNFPNIQVSPMYFRDSSAAFETRRFYRAVSP